MRRWCSQHASVVRKTTKYVYFVVILQLPGKTATHYISHLMTRHRTTWAVWDFSMVWWTPDRPVPLHTSLNLIKTKNLIAWRDIDVKSLNWTVTVIIRFWLASEINVDDTASSPSSALSWTWTTMADGYKFLAVRRLSRRLLEWL